MENNLDDAVLRREGKMQSFILVVETLISLLYLPSLSTVASRHLIDVLGVTSVYYSISLHG